MSKYTKLLMALCVAAFAASHIGCNTTKGAGEDMQRAGEHIQDAADNNR